jgi:hypothetical protein
MKTTLALLIALAMATTACATELKPFEFAPDKTDTPLAAQNTACSLPGAKLPADFAVYAAGAYAGRKAGFQIDQSGHEATRIDVAVHSPGKPVVLMLGAYEPTVWNIGWSQGTRVVAVLVSGYHRQAVAGLEKSTPLLVSTYDNRGPCGYFYVAENNLGGLNPTARKLFGRPVNMVYPAVRGKAAVGEPITADVKLVTSPDVTPDSFQDKSAPVAGRPGLEDAVARGLLRKATEQDAQAWADAVAANAPQSDLPPVAGQGIPRPKGPSIYNAYVVLKPFTFPAGLYGAHSATFLVLKGVPRPAGNPGHSAVYDFNTLDCQGAVCGAGR